MSLILDALKRSETEQKMTAQISMLDETSIDRKRFSMGLIGWVACLAVAVLIGLGYGWFESGAATEKGYPPAEVAVDGPVMHELGVQLTADRAQSRGEHQGERRSKGGRLPETGGTTASQNDALRRPPSLSSEELSALNRAMWVDAGGSEPQAADQRGETDVERAIGLLPGQGEVATKRASVTAIESLAAPAALDLQKVMERLALETGDAGLSPHAVPLLENLTQQQKDMVPTIVYSMHQYLGDDATFVELNGSRLRAGESSDAIRVIEILADSVIVSAAGTEFRLKALNSWINL
tara:strand:+ start:1891 stop:2775 length:885 start_codon:yes stop_codon:yes gene_type:complete